MGCRDKPGGDQVRLQQPAELAAVQEDVLAGDVAGAGAAEEGAHVAELRRIAEAAGGDDIVGPGSDRGNEVLAHVSAQLDLPFAANVSEVRGDELTRIRWGGTLLEEARIHADRRLLRMLTPVLRPAFRWNHDWAIARAMEGLEPYAQRLDASR